MWTFLGGRIRVPVTVPVIVPVTVPIAVRPSVSRFFAFSPAFRLV